MFDDFELEQKIIYRTIVNSINLNKISHAYIIETNGVANAFNFSIALAKYILCPNKYSNGSNCFDCSQCLKIDKNEFLELKIIDPTGMWIKKGELVELQDIFSKKSIIGNRKVYIINNAHKLNDSSSNSILKFLEEPEEGITAILIVNNINQLLSTIVSRCQILSLINNKKLDNLSTIEKIANHLKNSDEEIKTYVEKEENNLKIKNIIDFINYYEDNHYNSIIYIKKIWDNIFKEKNDIYDAFTIILLFYRDVLYYNIGKNILVFGDYYDSVKYISDKNKKNKILYKINVIMNLREKIKFNINSNLLMDKLIIELEGCENQ